MVESSARWIRSACCRNKPARVALKWVDRGRDAFAGALSAICRAAHKRSGWTTMGPTSRLFAMVKQHQIVRQVPQNARGGPFGSTNCWRRD